MESIPPFPTGVRYLRLKQIIGDKKAGSPPIIPISKSSWWAGVAAGRFPKPVKLGPRTTVWRSEDILALFEHAKEAA
ncbi:AlpA family phage regulatory protein [Geomonas sp. Red32]|uniref:helix-turn-helix transcriptional regulator n=1 Tax=Geomonas sp. Red32 TaxID=2912856 RepID=UPI002545F555|nr:AlpA family phage regulatory protein [Geomonas sp. Red32]